MFNFVARKLKKSAMIVFCLSILIAFMIIIAGFVSEDGTLIAVSIIGAITTVALGYLWALKLYGFALIIEQSLLVNRNLSNFSLDNNH